MKPRSLAALLFLAVLFTAASCLGFADYVGKVPSCNDQIAKTRNAPGTAELCTPAIFDRETALEFMNGGIMVKKIKGKWYVFLSESEMEEDFDATQRWQTIALLTSAVQSLFGKAESCYLAKVPGNDEEIQELLAGSYPRQLIAAAAEAVPFEEKEKSEADYDWPEYHHHLLYELTVY